MEIYSRALNEIKYKASAYHTMLVTHGGIGTAKRLLASPQISDGFQRLIEERRLDLTVEAMIWENPRFHDLFSAEELETVKRRLKAYRYPLEKHT